MNRSARNVLGSAAQLATAFFLFAGPVLAQEQTKPKLEDSPTGQVFRWINFVLVVVILLYLFRKAPAYFRGHGEEISQKIAEGARARASAETRRAEAQAKLATIDTEVAKMRDEASKAAALEAERIKTLARSEAEMIERAAQAEIAATEHAARLELKTLAAGMAVERAEALLRKELQPKVELTRFLEFVAAMSALVRQRQAKS
jgi:F0F1-type ATP synthase membrane subunit b/b'